MSYIPFTLLAFFFNSIAVSIDKILLTDSIKNPLVYIFYISLISLLTLLALPFAHIPSPSVFLLASLSTLLWTFAAYLMFKALKVGQVSRVIPVIGTLTPLILLLFAAISQTILISEVWASAFLISGLVFITLTDWRGKLSGKELLYEFLASLLFAVSYLFLREAYLAENFLTVLVWSRLILLPLGAIILLIPTLRWQIFKKRGLQFKFKSAVGLFFILGQTAGGASQLLLTFSISLANPALVNSLQGTQYVFLLIISLILSPKFPQIFKKDSSRLSLLFKIIGIILIGVGLYMLSFSSGTKRESFKLGVTFSPKYAQLLGLDAQLTYLRMLNDLSLKRVRIPVYWDEVESTPDQFNFSILNFYLDEAFKKDIEVILILGQKQPRWPECHHPAWVNNLTAEEKKKEVLELLTDEVSYFKHFPNITIWQIENEPLFDYGVCDKNLQTSTFLKTEVELVRMLDKRPILITDSGELSFWLDSIGLSDIFGTSLYRSVWSPYLGSQEYPLPPIFYPMKDNLIRLMTGKKDGVTIITELQAEPWLEWGFDIAGMADQQAKKLSVAKLKDYFEYAKQTRFSQIYFWGVEWWYFMEKNGYPQYLEYAKSLFKENLNF